VPSKKPKVTASFSSARLRSVWNRTQPAGASSSGGTNVAANWSNRLMRYRILAQIVAIAIILAVLYFSRR